MGVKRVRSGKGRLRKSEGFAPIKILLCSILYILVQFDSYLEFRTIADD